MSEQRQGDNDIRTATRRRTPKVRMGTPAWLDRTPQTWVEQQEQLAHLFWHNYPNCYPMNLIRRRHGSGNQGDIEDIFDEYRKALSTAIERNVDPEQGVATKYGKVQGYIDFKKLTSLYITIATKRHRSRRHSREFVQMLQDDGDVLHEPSDPRSEGEADLTEQLTDLQALVPKLLDAFFASGKRNAPLRLELGALLAGTGRSIDDLLGSPYDRLELLKIIDPIRFARGLNPDPKAKQPFQPATDEQVRQWLSRGKQELAALYQIIVDNEEGLR